MNNLNKERVSAETDWDKVEKITQKLVYDEEHVDKVHKMVHTYVRRRYVKDMVYSIINEAKKSAGFEGELTDAEFFRVQYNYAKLLLERASKY